MQIINTSESFHTTIASPELTIAVFKADWCGDCKYIDPFMPEVESHYADRLRLVEVDVDGVGDVSQEQNIMGIPSFVAYANGKELIRFVNKARKSRQEIEQFLDRAVEVYNTLNAQTAE
ncbi:thioredoxin family protein [Paenibacillus kandeliae]|uniref:thioredoxin family protein n=1 Tax=Paenibacillus kandeliae TaxID=3231269 RepID=UPI0034593FC5